MKAKKKPITLETWQFGTDMAKPKWVHEAMDKHIITLAAPVMEDTSLDMLNISTLEGAMTANSGDWIMRGTKGEIWSVRKDIFEEAYDIVEG